MELYIHIPFCVRKCRYCDFVSFPGRLDEMEDYITHVLREAELRSAALPAQLCRLDTVYIGGGTPSLLPPSQLSRLMEGLRRWFDFSGVTEFTVEANPGTVTEAWADTAVRLGVNRVSMGMQAFQPHLLHTLGRIHTYEDVERSVKILRDAGIRNLSLDLMFGLPGQTMEDWRESLSAALRLAPEHISAYGLIPEENTPLYEDLQRGVLKLPEPEEERAMYDEALSCLSRQGFEQYEISNFSLPGFACVHNIGYWTQVPYLGLGLAAASMFPEGMLDSPVSPACQAMNAAVPEGSTEALPEDSASGQGLPLRQWENGFRCLRETNPASFEAYDSMLRLAAASSSPERITERVSAEEARFETMMLGLRMNAGVSEAFFRRLHGVSLDDVYGKKLRRLAEQGLVTFDSGSWRLTRKGMDLQNTVLVELM